MAGSPKWKVYDESGQYVAACKMPEHAAALVGAIGGSIRYGHSRRATVWREGEEEFGANESWDGAASLMSERMWGRLPR